MNRCYTRTHYLLCLDHLTRDLETIFERMRFYFWFVFLFSLFGFTTLEGLHLQVRIFFFAETGFQFELPWFEVLPGFGNLKGPV